MKVRQLSRLNIPLIPIMIIVATIIIGALSSTLINSAITQSIGDVDHLKQENVRLTAISKHLDDELERTRSLSFIAQRAKEQGLVPATLAGRINADGTITEYTVSIPDGARQLTTPHRTIIYPPGYPLLYNATVVNPPHDFPSPEDVDKVLEKQSIDTRVCSRETTTIDYHMGQGSPTVTCSLQ